MSAVRWWTKAGAAALPAPNQWDVVFVSQRIGADLRSPKLHHEGKRLHFQTTTLPSRGSMLREGRFDRFRLPYPVCWEPFSSPDYQVENFWIGPTGALKFYYHKMSISPACVLVRVSSSLPTTPFPLRQAIFIPDPYQCRSTLTLMENNSPSHSGGVSSQPVEEKTPAVAPYEAAENIGAQSSHLSGLALSLCIFALCIATLCVALDNTIIATAIPRITDDFHSLKDVGWYGSCKRQSLPTLPPVPKVPRYTVIMGIF